jgi:uncharacterized protein YjbJ (UPF0337 family)
MAQQENPSTLKQEKPSTFQSMVEGVTATVQSGIGKLTGNTTDQAAGELKKQDASREYEASQAAAKAGPFTASSAGAVTVDDKDRTTGSWNQTVGAAKESIGSALGSADLKAAGHRQAEEGRQQQAAGEVRDYTSGLANRMQGSVGGAVAGLTGDTQGQKHYEHLHDQGKTQQRGVEVDLTKQVEAERRS